MQNFYVDENVVKQYVKKRFVDNFGSDEVNSYPFEFYWDRYKVLPTFKINENMFADAEQAGYDDVIHFILRTVTQFFITKAFEAMKIDLKDPNVAENPETGNIGTPGRIAKMWCGTNTHDDRELMGGRFHKPVRLAKFPNEISEAEYRNPIIKEVDLTAVCSHHLAPFGTLVSSNLNAKVIISYIPDKYVLGISKLQRVVRYIAQRGWLQEDLTKAIYNEISKTAETGSVYVKLKNIEHSCEKYRGAMSQGDGFTTEYYGGAFREDPELLKMVRSY
jgi:GTP cyclohydrolase I